jgi:hypothetical protein
VTRLAIESDVPMPVHLNGDYVGVTPAVFELTPSAFRVLAPPGLAGEAVRVVPEKPRGVAAQVARA